MPFSDRGVTTIRGSTRLNTLFWFYRLREQIAQIPQIMAEAKDKKHFCAFVLSNPHNPPTQRKKFFQQLSEYKPVHSYGRVFHNRDLPEPCFLNK